MHTYADTLGLSDSSFALLRDLIHERTGLFYENGKGDVLSDKLSTLVIERGFNSFLDYYYLLKYDAEADREWKRVMDALSVQETFFWREMDQIRALVEVIVPEYFKKHGDRPLRIWSAACATGEEPLSIAMLLNEKGWFERGPIEIYASDASRAAVEKARRGVYRDRSFRNLPAKLKARYFEPVEKEWKIAPDLHQKVKWSTANLMSDSDTALMAASPVIFCRNVFIYFSDEAIRKAVRMFARRMPLEAYLFVAASESLLRITTEFQFEEIGGAFVYVKK